jgi:hypothetical protein
LADTLNAEDVASCGRKWLAYFTPFFSDQERLQAACQHRLFFSQIEFCDNLIFHRRVALDKLGERLLAANRTIGQPNKVSGARSPGSTVASRKPRSRTCTYPTPSSAATTAMASSSSTSATA